MIESPRISLSRAHRHFIQWVLWGWKGGERRERRCKRSDRIYPDEERSGRYKPPFRPYFSFPPHLRWLRSTSPREDLNFRIRFLSRVIQGFAGSAGDGKRNEIPEGETVSEWARARARLPLSAPCLRAGREIPSRRFDSFRDDLFGQGPSRED